MSEVVRHRGKARNPVALWLHRLLRAHYWVFAYEYEPFESKLVAHCHYCNTTRRVP